MYDIIPLVEIDHEPRVDSRLIAEQLGIQHQNFRELIQDHQADFEEFGQLRFETGVTNGHQGGGFSLMMLLEPLIERVQRAKELLESARPPLRK